MNFGTIIKNKFRYLKKYGYKHKIYSKNTDYEVYYFKNNSIIEIYYSLCFNEVENNQNFAVFVILSNNGERKELFQCSKFSTIDLKSLEENLNSCKTEEEKIEVYAQFIQANILMLL